MNPPSLQLMAEPPVSKVHGRIPGGKFMEAPQGFDPANWDDLAEAMREAGFTEIPGMIQAMLGEEEERIRNALMKRELKLNSELREMFTCTHCKEGNHGMCPDLMITTKSGVYVFYCQCPMCWKSDGDGTIMDYEIKGPER